ncbi:hypothetical protein [Gracilibacillus halophilus]|uniref:hypothetical protein n=1 Tax=Gracilibacillus halophilus TaxID=470864 RepID=UPI0003A984C2|nr:hypothetical protein [Gracilibacillus halophilus]
MKNEKTYTKMEVVNRIEQMIYMMEHIEHRMERQLEYPNTQTFHKLVNQNVKIS